MKIDDIKLWLANIELNTTFADDDKTVKDVFDSMSEEQKIVVYYLIAEAVDVAVRDKKMSEIDSPLYWHLGCIDRTTKRIKELAEQ